MIGHRRIFFIGIFILICLGSIFYFIGMICKGRIGKLSKKISGWLNIMQDSEVLFEKFKDKFGIKKFILFYISLFILLCCGFILMFIVSSNSLLRNIILFSIVAPTAGCLFCFRKGADFAIFDWFSNKFGIKMTVLIHLLVIVIGFFIFSCFIYAGCGKVSKKEDVKKVNVVVTTFPIYDLVRQVALDKQKKNELINEVNLNMLMMPGVDTHSYEPTPKDIKLIENSDLFIYIGGKGDLWVKKILASFDDNKKNKIKIINLIESLGFDSNDDTVDSHIWTSLGNSVNMAKVVAGGLIAVDSKRSSNYSDNLNKYMAKVNNLKHRFEEVISNSKNKTLVFADKFPFKYFVEEFKLNYKTPFANCSAKTEPIASEIGKISNFVKENNISVILRTDYGNGEIAEMISKETGAKVRKFHSCHTISKDEFLKGKTYLDYMEDNLEVLKEALS